MNCPDAELLLRHADGQPLPPAVVAHVAHCPDCQAQLHELALLETQIAAAATLDGDERSALRATSERLLAARAVPRGPRWRRLAPAALAVVAAALLATLASWPRGERIGDVVVRRYVPDGTPRSAPRERFALDVELTAPRWLALWQVDANGVTRLLPHADPLLRWLGATMPLPRGRHRVPAADVFDFELAPAAPPRGLLLIATAAALTDAEHAAIAALLAATDPAALLAAVRAKWPDARWVVFPAR